MASIIRLNCKNIASNGSIAGIGGLNHSTNVQNHYTEAQAITAIDTGTLCFEVHDSTGHVAKVRVAHRGEHRFLETHRDGVKTDNLENLPVCHHAVHPTPVPLPYRPAPVQRGHCVFVLRIGVRK